MSEISVRGVNIDRRTLASQLYAILEDKVLSGELLPGARLSEELVGKVFGVSRSPAREALADLERSGLAVRVGSRDRMITIPTADMIAQKYDLWWIVDVGRAYLASLVATKEEIAELKSYIDQMAIAIRKKDTARYQKNCDLFHNRLRAACRNACVAKLAEDCELHLRWFAALYDKNPEISMAVVEEHYQILKAYKRQDLAKLSTSVRDHIMRQRERILAAFRQQPMLSADTPPILTL
jgi:DNA-binding GntR family transcriptional regulator